MEYQKKLLLITALLVVVALYFAVTTVPPKPVDNSPVQNLLMKGIVFGKGQANYAYSFSEITDGYKNSYVLVKNVNESAIELDNPLSSKKAYFMNNDTILCVKYVGNETCSSIADNVDLSNYVAFLQSKFFNDQIIDRNTADMQYLLDRKYVTLNPEIITKKVSGIDCSQIKYVLDLSNLTLDEAAKFGINSNSPKVFYWSMCVDNKTGYLYERQFSYMYNNLNHTSTYTLGSMRPGTTIPITQPELVPGVIVVLQKEREQQIRLASCFTDKQGDEQNKCVSVIALDLHRKDLCELAGPRRDRCLVSLIPVTKDETTCPMIGNQSFKDDCYIELAGAYKNSTYCGNIVNQTKITQCMGAAKPNPPASTIVDNNSTIVSNVGNVTNNQTNVTKIDEQKLLNYIETKTTNVTNSSVVNATNSSN